MKWKKNKPLESKKQRENIKDDLRKIKINNKIKKIWRFMKIFVYVCVNRFSELSTILPNIYYLH